MIKLPKFTKLNIVTPRDNDDIIYGRVYMFDWMDIEYVCPYYAYRNNGRGNFTIQQFSDNVVIQRNNLNNSEIVYFNGIQLRKEDYDIIEDSITLNFNPITRKVY